MITLSKILKVIAKILGGLLVAYGFVIGVLGTGPDGPHESFLIRIVGAYITLLGLVYIYPNSKISGNRKKTIAYLLFTASPVLMVGVATIYTISREGLQSFIIQDGHLVAPVLIAVSLIAPISLIIANSKASYNHANSADAKSRAAD
jgi:hypothetical protein